MKFFTRKIGVKEFFSSQILQRNLGTLSLLIFFVIAGCVTVPPIMNQTDLTSVDFSNLGKFKKGSSCTTLVLNFIPFGSTTILDAIRDGHIKRVKIVEYETRYFYVFSQYCILAYGE